MRETRSRRYVALSILILFAHAGRLVPTHAQPPPEDLLWRRLRAEIERILDEADGVVGLAVKDLTTGHQILIHGDVTFPQASAIKIPILLEVLKQAAEGRFRMSDRREIEKRDHVGGSGILKEFGDRTSALSIGDLATLMIVLSDNTATNILIDLVGMENVNRTLESLGLTRTRLRRKMMDQEASARGQENTSTPAEAMQLLEKLYRGEAISRRVSEEALAILKKPKSSLLMRELPADVVIANKPGSLEGVVCEWGVVYLPRRPYLFVAMSTYGVGESVTRALARIARLVYDHFWRLSRSTPYGVRVPPQVLEGRPRARAAFHLRGGNG